MKRSTTHRFNNLARRGLLVVAAIVVAGVSHGNFALADTYDDQVKQLEAEVSSHQQEASRLRKEADTLQNALSALTAQKNAIQSQIDLSQAKAEKLKADIEINEQKLERQKKSINKTIAQIYANGSTSPIEMLASSKNVGEYVSSQAVRGSVQNQLRRAMDEVKRIKVELTKQKIQVDQVLQDQQSQRTALAAKEAEQATLLAQTQGQEAAYQGLIANKNSQISSLRAQQAAANAAAARTYSVSGLVAGSGCGGYPAIWCDVAQDSVVDSWGMYNRECVSYTAWKVAASGRHMPYWGGRGNANEWPSSAAADGIPTGSTPKVGSVAIMYVGYYGHAMYVERINSNGTIHVSQFNWGIRGEYTEMDINPSGLTFIYF